MKSDGWGHAERPDFEDELLVATVPLTPKKELRAQLQSWKGERRCDLRVFTHYARRDK